jgi:hypothetical protein
MAQSGYKTLPKLEGSLVYAAAGSSLLARAGYRIYPYQLGAMVYGAQTAVTTLTLSTLGEFAANDYLMVCSKVDYGDFHLFVPDLTRIAKVNSLSGSNDQVVLATALTVADGEYAFNLGADANAPSSTVTPAWTNSDYAASIYTDPSGTGGAQSAKYILTSNGGWFRCWLPSGTLAVDLLIHTDGGTPVAVWPLQPLALEIMA